MGLTDYLVSDVSKEEFGELKSAERNIYDRALESVNDVYRGKVAGLGARLRYNSHRGMVGIWLGIGPNIKLARSTSNLTEEERILASAMYEEIQNGLEIIRGGLEAEEWVDKIDESIPETPVEASSAPDPTTTGKEKDDIPF